MPTQNYYFYIDLDAPDQLLQKVSAFALQSYLAFNCKACANKLMKWNELVPSAYLQYVHCMNQDDACKWGMVEMNLRTSPPSWTAKKRAPEKNDLSIDAPTENEFSSMRTAMKKFVDRSTGEFNAKIANEAVKAYELLEKTRAKLMAAEVEVEELKGTMSAARKGRVRSGGPTSARSMMESRVSSPAPSYMSRSPSIAGSFHALVASAVGGSFYQHQGGALPTFTELMRAAAPAQGQFTP
ncbi:hypothetical protein DXG01_008320, partial [Tephrocybe rancida]